MTSHGIRLTLLADGGALAELVDTWIYVAEVDGELNRHDVERTALEGRWRPADGEIDISLRAVRMCSAHVEEPDCAHPEPLTADSWHLRCEMLAPTPESPLAGPALICVRLGTDLPPKGAVTLAGHKVLVLYSERTAAKPRDGAPR